MEVTRLKKEEVPVKIILSVQEARDLMNLFGCFTSSMVAESLTGTKYQVDYMRIHGLTSDLYSDLEDILED